MSDCILITVLLILGTAWVAPIAHADSKQVISLGCARSEQAKSVELPSEKDPIKFAVDSENAWLELEDTGQQTEIVSGPSSAISIPQPLRYGWHWVHLDHGSEIAIRRTESNNALGTVKATLHCETTSTLSTRLDWLQTASDIGKLLDKPTDAANLARLLDRIRLLEESSPDSTAHAIALHYRAEALAANSRDADASQAFESAEMAWIELNDNARALAAHVGRVETLRNQGESRSLLGLIPAIRDLRGTPTYFSVRLENSRCQVLQTLGSINEAATCFSWELASYEKLGETSEYVVALQNYASVLRDHGRLEDAQRLGMQGLEIATGTDAPKIRGFLRVMLADIALRRGQISESLQQSNLALDEFANTTAGGLRWQANTYLTIAIIYAELGANDESYTALAQAVSRLSARDAPSRMAVAMNIFADLEANTHHTDSALFWRRTAEETYSRLGMAAIFHATRWLRLELEEQQGGFDSIASALAENVEIEPLYTSLWLLLKADVAIEKGRLDEARTALADLRERSMSMRDRIRFTVLEAKYHERSGDVSGAQALLLQTAQRLNTLTTRSGSPILHDLIARQQLPLQRSAVAMALRHVADESESANVQTLWSWLAMTTASPGVAGEESKVKDAESFDRAVAAELLVPPSQKKPSPDDSAQRELLSLIALPDVHADATISILPIFPLEALQQRLDASSVFIAYLDGESHGALLWVTRDTARVLDAAPPDEIRTSTAALSAALRSPDSPVSDVQSAARTLSTQLLRGASAMAPPKHLLVLADESMPRVSWSALVWPGQTEPLLDTTTVELVSFDAANPGQVNRDAAPLHVIVASQQQAGDNQLASLATANAEPQLIQAALTAPTLANPAAHPISIADGAAATREAVLSAFAEPGAWVHIAAHGTAQPQRIGYAGLWLEPSGADKTPAFLSWLDILDKGVRADLVVLNACQLGDSGNAINGNLSFAAAVSRAGAKQVVAALWPVSDSAAALWVPAFYAALAADPEHNAAAALRAAQLRLRASRAFAHPFFWAGMQATARLSPGAPASVVASAQKPKLH